MSEVASLPPELYTRLVAIYDYLPQPPHPLLHSSLQYFANSIASAADPEGELSKWEQFAAEAKEHHERAIELDRQRPKVIDLSMLPVEDREAPYLAFVEGDGKAFAGWAYASGSRAMMLIVERNIKPLKEKGIYEAALLEAIIGCKINHRGTPPTTISAMLAMADRDRLRAAGDPLPGTGPFTLYRGVAGRGPARRVRGLSWTGNLGVACWFAKRFADLANDAKPAVFTATVTADQVYAYTNCREEQEFICAPARPIRLTISDTEMVEAIQVRDTVKDPEADAA